MININKHSVILTLGLLALTGCNLVNNENTSEAALENTVQTNQAFDLNEIIQQAQQQKAPTYHDATLFKPFNHHKTLVNYVEQMALELVDTMQYEGDIAIAVTSFVNLDASLNNTGQLGNQLSEGFIHQLQQFNYPVIDFKTTDQILVNNRGDFVFSREVENLGHDHIATHVLSGTLIYRSNGVEVNSRIIDIDSKRVIASSQKLLPYYVLTKDDINLQRASLN